MGRLVLLAVFGLLVAGIGSACAYESDSDCPSKGSPVPVLVAKRLISKGTPGSVILNKGMYVAAVLPCSETKPAVIGDPPYLLGKIAAVDLFPGQQLTEADFTSG